VLPPLGDDGRILRIHVEAAVLRISGEMEQTEYSGFALTGRVILKPGEELRHGIALESDGSQQDLFGEIARLHGIKKWNYSGLVGKKKEEEEL
jgi:hypothetical protein